ncbi:GntR family transcriptional regulator [Parasphingorhabdus halotolerans]|uniref:Winged helix-turn-helix transcriptional regulator n=1 Tax=Parasphingorhabdus halotolerans TaxID=2725558 RepID=A0A6H2DMM5_9SPHN|nr:winged helix-turn-helix domain-containing protein [Parasphingorhabdus halotolerans]QJB69919.1 winged helix-turn-helix transcriptional regulator [Parasphingorhabdus halotolerans]
MANMFEPTASEVNWVIDRTSGDFSGQIVHAVRMNIQNGRLRPSDRLPSARKLALELGVARGTVNIALDILIAEGLIEARQGSGTFVCVDAKHLRDPKMDKAQEINVAPIVIASPKVDENLDSLIDFRPCRPRSKPFR